LGAPADHLEGIRRIAIDEFAIRPGQQYATIVLDFDRKRVIARGRNREALRGFLTALGPPRCGALEAIAVNIWKPNAAEIRQHGPHVALVHDCFHIVTKYGQKVIDRVWVHEAPRRIPS
jgi:transposase